MNYKDSDKWTIPGMTGVGKTFFIRYLIKQYMDFFKSHRLYVYDSKGVGDFDYLESGFPTNSVGPRPLRRNERIQVWTPVHLRADYVSDWMQNILDDENSLLVIDEGVHVQFKNSTLDKYVEILKIGRAKGIGVATALQSLTGPPDGCLSQVNHFICFKLMTPYDRRIASNYLRKDVRKDNLPKYSFRYIDCFGNQEQQLYTDVQEFFSQMKGTK